MKGRYQPGFVLMLVFLLLGQAQAQLQEMLPSGSLQEQFDYLNKESNRYQRYKLVPQTWLNAYWANVNDTLLELKGSVKENQLAAGARKNEIDTLLTEKQALHDRIASLRQEKNSLSFLGLTIEKSVYHVLVWAIIAALSVGLVFFLGRFRYANTVTRKARSDNQELQEKVEQLRRRMLEKEQELRRQLQDEINKRLG